RGRARPPPAHGAPGRRDLPRGAQDRGRDLHLHQRQGPRRGDGGRGRGGRMSAPNANLELTPRRIVEELAKYIVGQMAAKKAVATAIRNRLRRQLLDEEMRRDVLPKNLILIGPTGVGKTEIARRIANLIDAPFVKVEASKFTEVGYVGRDVESMVRDLVDAAINLVRTEREDEVYEQAEQRADERLLDLLLPAPPPSPSPREKPADGPSVFVVSASG